MRNTTIESHNGQLMSKTQHYRKVTKPLLERKRRARMNHYLEELKNLIVETMETEGEHITKMEKADILEMTVNYLKTKNQAASAMDCKTTSSSGGGENINTEKFRAGFTQAAYEVSKVFASVPGLDVNFGTKLMKSLGYKLKDLQHLPSQQTKSSNSSEQRSQSPPYHTDQINYTPPQSPEPQLLPTTSKLQNYGNYGVLNMTARLDFSKSEKHNNQNPSDVWRPW